MTSKMKTRYSLTPRDGASPESDECVDPLTDLDIGPIKVEQDLSSDSESSEEEIETPSKKTRTAQNQPKQRTHKSRKQGETLIAFMSYHPEIAKGLVKGERSVLDAKWSKLKTALNADGPPFKSISAWKKVWSDWKITVRRKVSHMKKDADGICIGNQYVALTSAEESIAQLCGFYDKVEIVPLGKSFGYSEENDDIPQTRSESRKSKTHFKLTANEEAIAELCGFYGTEEAGEPTKSMNRPNKIPNQQCKQSADFDQDLIIRNRKRRRGPNSLEELCDAQNALMTRVVDTLEAIRSNMAQQTNVMQKHFKRMEEIELRKLEAFKCFKK